MTVKQRQLWMVGDSKVTGQRDANSPTGPAQWEKPQQLPAAGGWLGKVKVASVHIHSGKKIKKQPMGVFLWKEVVSLTVIGQNLLWPDENSLSAKVPGCEMSKLPQSNHKHGLQSAAQTMCPFYQEVRKLHSLEMSFLKPHCLILNNKN